MVRIDELTAADWPAVKTIYEHGIATRLATFEIAAPTWEEWDHKHLPFARLVARGSELDSDEAVLGWAALAPVSTREVYRGVAEVSVYVAAPARGQGVGTALLGALANASEHHGIWSLQASVFPENAASLRLHDRCGFRVVGRRERIARLDGVWRDTLLLERRTG